MNIVLTAALGGTVSPSAHLWKRKPKYRNSIYAISLGSNRQACVPKPVHAQITSWKRQKPETKKKIEKYMQRETYRKKHTGISAGN